MPTRLIISECEIQDIGLFISKFSVIDSETGDELRIVRITPELVEFLKHVEIDTDYYFEIEKMKQKQPNFRILIKEFNLIT